MSAAISVMPRSRSPGSRSLIFAEMMWGPLSRNYANVLSELADPVV